MKYIALGVSLMFILFAIGGMLEIIVKKIMAILIIIKPFLLLPVFKISL